MSEHEQPVEVDSRALAGETRQTPAVADDVLPDTLHLIPVPYRPFFPGQVQPIAINLREWGSTLEAVRKAGHGLIGLSYVDLAASGSAEPRQFPEIGCVVRLHRPAMATEQTGQFLAQGIKRFRIVRWLSDKPPYLVQVEYPRSQGDRDSDEIKAYAMALIKQIRELLPLNPLYSEELKQYLANFSPSQPSMLADFSAALTTATGEQLQEILDTLPLRSRMEKVLTLLRKEREVAELQGQITSQVNEKVMENQREFFLREQLKIIQKELGISKDDRTSDVEMFAGADQQPRIAGGRGAAHRGGDAQALRAGDRLAGIRRYPQLSRLGDIRAVGRVVRGQSGPQARAHGAG